MKEKISKKATKHLKGDIKGYRKEISNLRHEIVEDKDLMKAINKVSGKFKGGKK